MYQSRGGWTGRILARANSILHLKRDGSQWKGLLELEEARSAPERRLLLIREFSHLAGDSLNANPARRRSWPSAERITALHTAATVLLSCAADQTGPRADGAEPDGPSDNDDLVTAIRTLVRYLALQQALQQAPVLDPEPMRLLAREHTRLRMTFDETTEWLRNS